MSLHDIALDHQFYRSISETARPLLYEIAINSLALHFMYQPPPRHTLKGRFDVYQEYACDVAFPPRYMRPIDHDHHYIDS